MVESCIGDGGDDVLGHAAHRQMVLVPYRHTHTHPLSLYSHLTKHMNTPLRQMHSSQTNRHETFAYVRVYEAARGRYTDALLLDGNGTETYRQYGMTQGGREVGKTDASRSTHTYTSTNSESRDNVHLWECELCDRKSLLEVGI